MAVTFKVDDVGAAKHPVEPIGARRQSLDATLKQRVPGVHEAVGCVATDFVKGNSINAFEAAAHYAYSQHRRLVLSPDDIWLCIAQGFALHMSKNAEALRDRFVAFKGKKDIEVRRDNFVRGQRNDWASALGDFSDAIAGYIGKNRDWLVANFTTTSPIEKTASEIVMMDAMQHFFRYSMTTLCGIPEITLLGTPDDWHNVQVRAARLSEFDLPWWTEALNPVLEQFHSAASGAVNTAFWRSFYKLNGGSGGPYATGYINSLFPYLNDGRKNRYVKTPSDGKERYMNGPTDDEMPSGLSKAPFTWRYHGQKLDMDLVAGFVGVAEDSTGAVRPAQGWVIREAVK